MQILRQPPRPPPRPLPRRSLAAALLLGALIASLAAVASASAAKRFYLEPLFVGVAMNNSAWAVANDVDARDCRGIGASKRDAAFQKTYASFRCAVHGDDGSDRGDVLVAPTGPEAVRIVRTLSGDPPPDFPLGAIPRGNGRLRSPDVAGLLESTRWAKSHRFTAAVCVGLGPFTAAVGVGTAGSYFGAFECRATVTFGDDFAVLVASAGKHAVRVVRQLA